MAMTHCYECGALLEEKELENEGIVPYCPTCKEYRFPIFNTAVSMLTIDPEEKKILLVQQYGRKNWILVAGYVNRGEIAEHAVRRELQEEVSLQVDSISFNRSCFFAPSNTLIWNFAAFVKPKQTVHPNWEVDRWQWFTFEEAREAIKPQSLAQTFLLHYLDGGEIS